MTSDAVLFTETGPIPAWFVHGIAAALNLPCRCPAPDDAAPTVHLAGCARGDAVTSLQDRARDYRQENP